MLGRVFREKLNPQRYIFSVMIGSREAIAAEDEATWVR
jgi:hypothetical protein